MIFLRSVISSLHWLSLTVIQIYMFVVIIRAILSWVTPDPFNPVVKTLNQLTEPVFYFFRRKLPFLYGGGIDFTPLAVIFILIFLRGIVDGVFQQFLAWLR